MTSAELITTVLASVGGSGAIIVGSSIWAGKVWAARIQEADKARFAREIEALKSSLEISRAREQRNSDAQFKLYSEIWNQLQDLKVIAANLWEQADENILLTFLGAIIQARIAVDKGRLVLRENDYLRLRKVLHVFESFSVGKKRLIQIRTSEEFREHYHIDSLHRIQQQIEDNRDAKEAYDRLLDEIVQEFRERLSLAA